VQDFYSFLRDYLDAPWAILMVFVSVAIDHSNCKENQTGVRAATSQTGTFHLLRTIHKWSPREEMGDFLETGGKVMTLEQLIEPLL
jgi:hypothetical protein